MTLEYVLNPRPQGTRHLARNNNKLQACQNAAARPPPLQFASNLGTLLDFYSKYTK